MARAPFAAVTAEGGGILDRVISFSQQQLAQQQQLQQHQLLRREAAQTAQLQKKHLEEQKMLSISLAAALSAAEGRSHGSAKRQRISESGDFAERGPEIPGLSDQELQSMTSSSHSESDFLLD